MTERMSIPLLCDDDLRTAVFTPVKKTCPRIKRRRAFRGTARSGSSESAHAAEPETEDDQPGNDRDENSHA